MSDAQDIRDDDALAAEYVLRLLTPAEEREFEARLDEDAALRAQVQFWEAEFATLADDLPEAFPQAHVKSNIQDRLGHTAPASRLRGFWGWIALPLLATAAFVVFFMIVPILRGPEFNPTLHATLMSADGAVHIEAGYAPDGNLFKVIPEQGSPAAGRDFELWVIGADAPAPVSLGVISTTEESLFEITPEIAALIDGGILAVSDEPAGGSPTGAPTGSILATDEFFDAKLFRAS
ncbi:anti-sigma factor [Shimia ponticola]|uniref:anti-sigma factor n=1 Tax=Shimia ponticola TaxID=2582893 RepID=UPI0011BFB3AA|nr:anti-sigma factor [Shimia ponticola]